MTKYHIVGLSGYAESGKNAASEVLVRDHGYTQLAYADKIREVLYALNPLIPGVITPGGYFAFDAASCRLADLIDKIGWHEAKKIPEVRKLLQRMGTEAGRGVFGGNFWVDQLRLDCSIKYTSYVGGREPRPKFIVTDVRFPNEVHNIRKRGGLVGEVVKAEKSIGSIVKSAVRAHASESSLETYTPDFTLVNDGTKEELGQKLVSALRERNYL